jgi:HD-like signal output (HDOD) protein
MPAEICEDLQANKISGLGNIQKLASASGSILLMNDPEKCSVKPLWVN